MQQLAQMGVVGPFVPGASQTNHIGHHGNGCGVGWLAAPVAVSQCGGSLLPVKWTPTSCSIYTCRCEDAISRRLPCVLR